MAGEPGAAGTREVMDGFAQDAAGGPRHRKPWLWGLGGMAMASVLWTAALSVHGPGDRRPDMHGYRLDQDPCPSLRLKSLGAAIAPRTAERDLGTGLLTLRLMVDGSLAATSRQERWNGRELAS